MIYFLYPVYNEEDNIVSLIESVNRSMKDISDEYKIIIVNDGSTDRSFEILQDCRIRNPNIILQSHYPNQGVMKTFDEGFRKFLELGEKGDVLVTQEADNTSSNFILKDMLDAVMSGSCDVALASCYHRKGKVVNTTLFRKVLSYSANLLVKIWFNLWKLNTFSSFYRVYSYTALEKVFRDFRNPMTVDGYCCVVELLVRLVRQNSRVMEIPMVLDTRMRKGKSKMKIIKTVKAYFRLLISFK